MSKFIEVRDCNSNLYYLNVDHIIMVQKAVDSIDAIIHFTAANQAGWQTIVAKEDFYTIMKLIKE